MLIQKYVHNGAVWHDFVCREELQLLLRIAIVVFDKYTIMCFDRNLSGENHNYADDCRKFCSTSTYTIGRFDKNSSGEYNVSSMDQHFLTRILLDLGKQ